MFCVLFCVTDEVVRLVNEDSKQMIIVHNSFPFVRSFFWLVCSCIAENIINISYIVARIECMYDVLMYYIFNGVVSFVSCLPIIIMLKNLYISHSQIRKMIGARKLQMKSKQTFLCHVVFRPVLRSTQLIIIIEC